MRNLTLALLCGLAVAPLSGQQASSSAPPLVAASVGDCQMSAEQVRQAEKITGDSAYICSPAAMGFHSRDEANAFGKLQALARDPATAPDAVNAAVAAFLVAWPASDFKSEAAAVAVRYYVARNNLPGIEAYGKLALSADRENMYVLSVMAITISGHVQDTDVDRDARLAEAELDANTLLTLLQNWKWDPTNGVDYKGHHYTPSEAAMTSAQYTAAANAALGRIALARHIYPIAVQRYQAAIDAVPAAQTAVYHFYRARAEAALSQYAAANADYAAAIANAGANTTVIAAARTEMAALPVGH